MNMTKEIKLELRTLKAQRRQLEQFHTREIRAAKADALKAMREHERSVKLKFRELAPIDRRIKILEGRLS